MDHLENRQMFEMLAGRVPPEQHKEGLRHIVGCSQCRSRWEELQATWGDLGQWNFQTTEYDFTASILSQVALPTTEPEGIRFFRLSSILRVAASILIGLFVGYIAGRMPNMPGSPSEQEIAQSMHLEALTLSSSTGFSEPLLEPFSTDDGIEP